MKLNLSTGKYISSNQTFQFVCSVDDCPMALEISVERISTGYTRQHSVQAVCNEANWHADLVSRPWDGFMTCYRHPVEFEDHWEELDGI